MSLLPIGTVPLVISLVLYFLATWTLDDEMDSVENLENITVNKVQADFAPPEGVVYLNNTGNPIIILWNSKTESNKEVHCGDVICDHYLSNTNLLLPPNTEGAYLFYASFLNFSNLPLPRNPTKVIWALTHEESPRNVLELMHDEMLSIFNYSTTFSRYSDVPYPLHYMGSFDDLTNTKFFVKTAVKNAALKELSPILYMQSSCETATERDEYVKELMKFQHIDSYGYCLRNRLLPKELQYIQKDYLNNLYDVKLNKFMARYKFVIAIENGVCNDYITEKLWRPLHLGIVPIYFGSPTVRDWLPNPKSAILIDDFSSPKQLSRYLNRIMEDDTLYEEHLEHKLKGKIGNQKLIEELEARPYQTDDTKKDEEFVCFLCKQLYNKNKTAQVVKKEHYDCPKSTCVLRRCKKDVFNIMFQITEESIPKLYEEIMFSNQVTSYDSESTEFLSRENSIPPIGDLIYI